MSVTRPTLIAGFSCVDCARPAAAGGIVLVVLAASCGDDAENEHESRHQDGGEAALWHFSFLQK